MTIKASGRSALILAAGLLVCFAGPSQAATDTAATASPKSETAAAPVALSKHARHGAHHWKKYAHRRSGNAALKSPADNKADDGDNSSSAQVAMPSWVANANAQMASGDTPTSNASAMSARANIVDGQLVPPDQLNDVDRALRNSAPPAPTVMASAEAPAAPAPRVAASSNESSTLDETSLIGKIFIGFGALLTIASAARMFMA